jgi:hypothetical protein
MQLDLGRLGEPYRLSWVRRLGGSVTDQVRGNKKRCIDDGSGSFYYNSLSFTVQRRAK